jgi:hypothetical protein
VAQDRQLPVALIRSLLYRLWDIQFLDPLRLHENIRQLQYQDIGVSGIAAVLLGPSRFPPEQFFQRMA